MENDRVVQEPVDSDEEEVKWSLINQEDKMLNKSKGSQ